ncbi:MAG TPA: hypothetical protein VGE21_03155 [Flavobacteriales bacterium]
MRSWTAPLPWVTVFAVAMAMLEAAVVVYLRALYYPGDELFPLVPIAADLAVTEVLREVATLVLLLAPAALVARQRLQRFAWFCYAFAIWDLFYYVFLKLLLDWPAGLFTWDLLFLLPIPWVGPVLAPCIVSVGLIAVAVVLLRQRARDAAFRPSWWEWSLMWAGAAVVLYTFVEGPLHFLLASDALRTGGDALQALSGHVPVRFSWLGFTVGCSLVLGALASMEVRGLRNRVAPW